MRLSPRGEKSPEREKPAVKALNPSPKTECQSFQSQLLSEPGCCGKSLAGTRVTPKRHRSVIPASPRPLSITLALSTVHTLNPSIGETLGDPVILDMV